MVNTYGHSSYCIDFRLLQTLFYAAIAGRKSEEMKAILKWKGMQQSSNSNDQVEQKPYLRLGLVHHNDEADDDLERREKHTREVQQRKEEKR